MNTKPIQKLTIILSLFFFILLLVTGLFKFLALYGIFTSLFEIFPVSQFNAIHDWSGIILLFLIALHIIFKRSYFISKDALNKKHLGLRMIVWYIVIFSIIIGIFVYIYVQNLNLSNENVKQLEQKQVREYEGENLSSIADLQNTGIKGTQYIDRNEYSLEVTGLVEDPKSYTYDQVLDLPKYNKVIELNCVVGWDAKILWEGILLEDLIENSLPKAGGKEIIFHARDGYTSSLHYDYIKDNDILLAYKINGIELPQEKGFPFQVVAEDKWGYKWVKWLTKIEVSDDTEYRGTYESSGYNREGDLDKPKREE